MGERDTRDRVAAAEILPLTGLRGLAALWVVVFHLEKSMLLTTLHPVAKSFVQSGYLGVDVFAILSGFVIAYNYSERLERPTPRAVLAYIWRRLARIYPLHLFTLGLMVIEVAALPSFVGRGASDGTSLVLSLLLVHGWGGSRGLAWNHPSWTVSVEWLCYLCFPLMALAARTIRNASWACFLSILMIIIAYYALSGLGVADFCAVYGWGIIRIGAEFSSGVLIARIHALGWTPSWPWSRLVAISVPLIVAFSIFPAPLVVVLAMWFLVAGLVTNTGLVAACLRVPPVVFLGRISYSIYLVHWVVFVAIEPICFSLGIPVVDSFLWMYYLGTSLICAVATFYLVENPGRKLLRRVYS